MSVIKFTEQKMESSKSIKEQTAANQQVRIIEKPEDPFDFEYLPQFQTFLPQFDFTQLFQKTFDNSKN